MNSYSKYISVSALALLLSACADETFSEFNQPAGTEGCEIEVSAEIRQVNDSRADDSGFADGDRIGLYVVNANDDGSAGELLPSGNWIDNVGLTYNEASSKWTADRSIYYKDDKTEAHFYAYYPYTDRIDNPRQFVFEVCQDQSAEATAGRLSAYEASDLMWV